MPLGQNFWTLLIGSSFVGSSRKVISWMSAQMHMSYALRYPPTGTPFLACRMTTLRIAKSLLSCRSPSRKSSTSEW